MGPWDRDMDPNYAQGRVLGTAGRGPIARPTIHTETMPAAVTFPSHITSEGQLFALNNVHLR